MPTFSILKPPATGTAITKKDGTTGRVPLDPRAPVYLVEFNEDGDAVSAVRATGAYVSHFSTCPKASQFSGTNYRPVPTDEKAIPPKGGTGTVKP